MIAIKPLRSERNRDFTFLLGGSDVDELKRGETLRGDVYAENLKVGPDYKPYVRECGDIRLSLDADAPTNSWSARALSYENDFCVTPDVVEALNEKNHLYEVRYDDGQGSKIHLINCDIGTNKNWRDVLAIRSHMKIAAILESLGCCIMDVP